jgi:tetrapyrrole methylase family protein / MazG family protein
MHLLEPVFARFNITSPAQITLANASSLAGCHVPPFPPHIPVLIGNFSSLDELLDVLQMLRTVYSDEHPLSLAWPQRSEVLTLGSVCAALPDALPEWLYIPALPASTSFEAFQEVVAHLRAPNGCPWDREQTHASLRTYLLEEAYETLSALDAGDVAAMREEFGDLLLQIILHAQIAVEADEFRMTDILRTINEKLVRRHPHVFGDVQVDSVGKVLQNWESLKAEERKANGQVDKGLLDGIPVALPALIQALEYQKRAARVGFDWPDAEGILDKICEEAAEVRSAGDDAQRAAEIGDLLFAVVNLARFYHVDAEGVLRETNQRFRNRFKHIEQAAKEQGRAVSDMTLEEMDVLWEAAKTLEKLP